MSCPASARKSDMVNKTFLLWDGEMDSHIFAASEVGSVLFFFIFIFLIYNFITKFKKKRNILILENPKVAIDAFYEFAVLPYTNQEIKETIKYLETFNIRSLKL